MSEDEETQKMQYINENIIDKGYNPEDVANFVMETKGLPFESLSLEKLKEVVEEFKDKGLNDTYSTIKKIEKKNEAKEKEKNEKTAQIGKVLYSPNTYEFETDYQQDNKLMELYRNNNLISISVSEPKKEGKSGFFSKSYTTYRVQCPQIEADVRRTYNDFEWLRSQLVSRYPLTHIPPIIKETVLNQIGNVLKLENEDLYEQKKIRYLNQFFQCLIKKKILRTSPLLLEFLILDTDSFKKYQNKINSKKYELSIKLDNLITMKGKVKCELKEDSISEANKMGAQFNSLAEIYNKIDACAANISNDFHYLDLHFNQISSLFNKLNENLTQNQYNNTDDIKKVSTDFSNIFNNWSISFKKQSEYFNKEFKETFNYLGLEIDAMNSIYKKYIEFKNEYETFTSMINKKKEDLFNSKKTQNWKVKPGTERDIPTYKDDKKVAFENMLYRENILLKEEKKRISATIHLMNKQYIKLLKTQNERVKKYYDSVKKNAKVIFGNEQMLKDLSEISKEK